MPIFDITTSLDEEEDISICIPRSDADRDSLVDVTVSELMDDDLDQDDWMTE
jgi:hypothetical protein